MWEPLKYNVRIRERKNNKASMQSHDETKEDPRAYRNFETWAKNF